MKLKLFIVTMLCTLFASQSFAATVNLKKMRLQAKYEIMKDHPEDFPEEYADTVAQLEEANGLNPQKGFLGLGGVREITLCGKRLDVPVWLYAICQGSLYTLPVNCTIASAATAGVACVTAIGIASASCGASVATITAIAKACIQQAL